jgi:hypothetical protein
MRHHLGQREQLESRVFERLHFRLYRYYNCASLFGPDSSLAVAPANVFLTIGSRDLRHLSPESM